MRKKNLCRLISAVLIMTLSTSCLSDYVSASESTKLEASVEETEND